MSKQRMQEGLNKHLHHLHTPSVIHATVIEIQTEDLYHDNPLLVLRLIW